MSNICCIRIGPPLLVTAGSKCDLELPAPKNLEGPLSSVSCRQPVCSPQERSYCRKQLMWPPLAMLPAPNRTLSSHAQVAGLPPELHCCRLHGSQRCSAPWPGAWAQTVPTTTRAVQVPLQGPSPSVAPGVAAPEPLPASPAAAAAAAPLPPASPAVRPASPAVPPATRVPRGSPNPAAQVPVLLASPAAPSAAQQPLACPALNPVPLLPACADWNSAAEVSAAHSAACCRPLSRPIAPSAAAGPAAARPHLGRLTVTFAVQMSLLAFPACPAASEAKPPQGSPPRDCAGSSDHLQH